MVLRASGSRYILICALAYIGFGAAWILLSDALLAQLLDATLMQRIGSTKGLFFVLLTAAYWSLALHHAPRAEPLPPGSRPMPGKLAWLIALLLPLAALLARQQLAGLVEHASQLLLLLMLPITLTALLGGLGPGLLATLVSVLAGWLLSPDLAAAAPALSAFEHLNLALLLANGLLVSLLSEGLRRALQRKRQSLDVLAEREQQLRRVLEGSGQGYWDWDLRAARLRVSDNLAPLLGASTLPDDAAGWSALLQADDLAELRALLDAHGRAPAHNQQIELRVRHADGGWKRLLLRGGAVDPDETGRPRRLSGTFSDVSERRELELALREAQLVFERSDEGIMVADARLRITRVNPAFCAITGYRPEEVIGHTPKLLSSGRHERSFYAAMWTALTQKGRWRGEIWNRRKNGEVYAEMLSINAVRDPHSGSVQHYVAVFTDISLLKQHAEEMQRLLHYDPLTGVPNRRLLTDRLQQGIVRAQRSGRALAVCLLDLDGFRHVNERHGEDLGNRLLVAVAEQLQQVLRPEDTLARLGGDEFVLMLSELSSTEEATQLLDLVLDALSRPCEVDGWKLQIGASIGVSLYPDDPSDPDTLLRHADQAMVQAKQAGRHRYQLFDPAAERRAQVQRELLQRLRDALTQGEFRLHYQPKVALADGRWIGVEALIRWQDSQRGLVPPGQFLPQIAGSAFEHELGDWVLDEAWRQAAAWQAEGLGLVVGINLGAHQLLAPGFIERLRERLARHPELPPACIELEVLESAAIHDLEQAIEVMARCRELGLRFALDDFGTGYSSLTYLRRLPVDTLKIDQSFVLQMLDRDDDRSIVAGVVGLARGFGLHVVAEGVESLALAQALRELGCEAAQGYGIARPMPAEALLAWRAGWRGLAGR